MPTDIENALIQNMADYDEVVTGLIAALAASDAAKAAQTQIAIEAVAAMNVAKGERDQAIATITAAVAASDAAENKARAALPGVPPVGGTPLETSYPDRVSFTDAVAAYGGAERVTLTELDGTVADVKGGTDPSLNYYVQTDGSISLTNPNAV